MSSKLEHCIQKVKSRQSIWCKSKKYPRTKDPKGKQCYNPWAVCKASLSRSRK